MKTYLLLSLAFLFSFSAEARRSGSSLPDSFKEESFLKQQIQSTGLDKIMPNELKEKCEGKDMTKMWTQLMIGLSYVESKWNDKDVNACDANCTASVGKFQMSTGDVAQGKRCFKSASDVKDPEKNIACAVSKMKELMTKNPSLTKSASRYWGPFGSGQYSKKGKGGAVVAMVASTCGGQNKQGSQDDYNFDGEGDGLATNNKEYWSQVESYSPYDSSRRSNSRRRTASR